MNIFVSAVNLNKYIRDNYDSLELFVYQKFSANVHIPLCLKRLIQCTFLISIKLTWIGNLYELVRSIYRFVFKLCSWNHFVNCYAVTFIYTDFLCLVKLNYARMIIIWYCLYVHKLSSSASSKDYWYFMNIKRLFVKIWQQNMVTKGISRILAGSNTIRFNVTMSNYELVSVHKITLYYNRRVYILDPCIS